MKQYRIIYESKYDVICGEGLDGCLVGNLRLKQTDTSKQYVIVVTASNTEMARYKFAAMFFLYENARGIAEDITDYFEDAVSNIVSISEVV